MKMLESAYQIEEDPYSRVNLLDLINEKESNLESQSTTLSDSLEYSSLNIRIEGIKVYLTCLLLQIDNVISCNICLHEEV